jgi:predicted phosphohydrolase
MRQPIVPRLLTGSYVGASHPLEIPHLDLHPLRRKAEDASSLHAQHVFVTFHHPPFNSSNAHFGDQHMRLLADVFEAGKVDVVLSGHVHNY